MKNNRVVTGTADWYVLYPNPSSYLVLCRSPSVPPRRPLGVVDGGGASGDGGVSSWLAPVQGQTIPLPMHSLQGLEFAPIS